MLILVGVTLKLVGNDGIIAKAKWSAYVTEYEAVEEQKEMYVATYYMDKFSQKKNVRDVYKMALLSLSEKTTDEKIAMYPVSEKLEIGSMYNSLKETIKYMENLQDNDLENEDLVNLYKVDFEKISANAKKTYAINIVSGMLYSIEYEEYQGKYYHTPRIGFVVDENGEIKDEIKSELNISEPGKYNVIINANEVVKWDSIEVVYKKFVDGTAEVSSFTSNELTEWSNVTMNETELVGNKEKYVINSAENSQYIKISINLTENENGENSEIYYVKVNYYKLEKTDIEPEVKNEGADVIGGIYTVPTSPSGNGSTEMTGTASVTQTVTLPEGDDEYILDFEEIGNPSTTVTIQKPDGTTETITGDELKNTVIPGGSTVTIKTDLNAGDGVGEIKVWKKDPNLSSTTTSTMPERVENWNTVEQKQYIYSNGGRGFWEKCFVNEDVVGSTGIIEKDSERRIFVQFLTSEDGASWSEPFTNLEKSENKRYLKVLVNYQTKNNAEYGDSSGDKITVMINDGYWTATFEDTDGNVLLSKKVYYINSAKQAKVTTLSTAPSLTGKLFLDWLVGSTAIATNTEYTMTKDTTFKAEYMPIDIYTVSDLTQFRDLVNRGVTYEGFTVNLMNDLDLGSTVWEPIGYFDDEQIYWMDKAIGPQFRGIFEGNSYSITINTVSTDTKYKSMGIFGLVNGATIQNLTSKGTINSTTNNYLGGIVGGMFNSKVVFCNNKANVSSSSGCVGGIVACSVESNINNCINDGEITGDGFSIAGIVAIGIANTISRSANNGDIIADNKMFANFEDQGGICGLNAGGKVILCYNTGKIINNSTQGNDIGGIVGQNGLENNIIGDFSVEFSTIENCYNLGKITCGKMIRVGGITGWNVNLSILNNCYSKGEVIGKSSVGSVAGCNNLLIAGTITNTFFLSETGTIGIGSGTGSATSKTSTYFTYPATNTASATYLLNGNKTSGVWAQSSSKNGGYPYLKDNEPE